jgi:hypothetical protein
MPAIIPSYEAGPYRQVIILDTKTIGVKNFICFFSLMVVTELNRKVKQKVILTKRKGLITYAKVVSEIMAW